MQLYAVKLPDNHKAHVSQVVDGYLGWNEVHLPSRRILYSRGEAIKKASRFGGKIEKVGRDYDSAVQKILIIYKEHLTPRVKQMTNWEPDEILGSGRIAVWLEEEEELTPEEKTELEVLSGMADAYEYVRFV